MRTWGRLTAVFIVAVALAVPAAAAVHPSVDPMNAGGGVARGTLAFEGTRLPAVGAPCRTVTFTLTAAASQVAVNSVIAGYAGPVTLTGTGSGACESMTVGEGTMTLRLYGRNETTLSEVECPTLSGRYARLAGDMTLNLAGECTVNRFGAGVVLLTARLAMVPTAPGAGVLTSVAAADVDGAFVVVPN